MWMWAWEDGGVDVHVYLDYVCTLLKYGINL